MALYYDLPVYRDTYQLILKIFECTKDFPKEYKCILWGRRLASGKSSDSRTLYEVQQILGHSDPRVTMRYAHLSTKALLEAANSAAVKIRG